VDITEVRVKEFVQLARNALAKAPSAEYEFVEVQAFHAIGFGLVQCAAEDEDENQSDNYGHCMTIIPVPLAKLTTDDRSAAIAFIQKFGWAGELSYGGWGNPYLQSYCPFHANVKE